jgi:hypothetical protein
MWSIAGLPFVCAFFATLLTAQNANSDPACELAIQACLFTAKVSATARNGTVAVTAAASMDDSFVISPQLVTACLVASSKVIEGQPL